MKNIKIKDPRNINDKINVTLDEVLQFSNSIGGERREFLNNNLKVLCKGLEKEIKQPCNIWIFGSYVSDKSEPSDIDMRIFLHEEDYNELYLPYLFEIIESQESYKFDLEVDRYNLNDLNEEQIVLVNGYKSMALSERSKSEGDIIENSSGFFQIDLNPFENKLD